jgi:maltose-binding protein MalE
VPQIANSKEVNFANYWVESVAKSSENPDWAWDFILFETSEEQVGSYLETAQKPTALRNLISDQLEDSMLGAFAEQTLTAESWYHGYNSGVAEDIFEDLIDAVLSGSYEDKDDVMNNAAAQISATYKQ